MQTRLVVLLQGFNSTIQQQQKNILLLSFTGGQFKHGLFEIYYDLTIRIAICSFISLSRLL